MSKVNETDIARCDNMLKGFFMFCSEQGVGLFLMLSFMNAYSIDHLLDAGVEEESIVDTVRRVAETHRKNQRTPQNGAIN